MQSLQIPTAEEIRIAVRSELTDFFSNFNFQAQPQTDEIGKGAEFASKITGKAVPTIYELVQKRSIPHSKQGGDLYFSRNELLAWLLSGKRKTQLERALETGDSSGKGSARSDFNKK